MSPCAEVFGWLRLTQKASLCATSIQLYKAECNCGDRQRKISAVCLEREMNFLLRLPKLISGLTVEVGQRWGTTVGQIVLFGGVHSLLFLWEGDLREGFPPAVASQLESALHAWTSCLQLSAWGVPSPPWARPGWEPSSQQGFCSPWPDQAPCLRWEIQKLTFLKKGPAQIKHVDVVSRPVHGLAGRCADGKSRLPNSSAVILPEQRCREVQEL